MKYQHINEIGERLIEAENAVKKAENKNQTAKNDGALDWEPQVVEIYDVPPFCIAESAAKGAKAKLRKKLAKVYAFILLNQSRRSKEYCTIMPIAVTDKRLQSICGGYPKAVSRLNQFMMEIGLISLENGNYSKKEKRAKIYRYYIENEREALKYIKEHKIDTIPLCTDDEKIDTLDMGFFAGLEVRFSSNLHLVKPSNWNKPQFERYLLQVLKKNYPQLQHYLDLSKEINKKYYKNCDELAVRYIPSFTWNNENGSKYVRKISIRATNKMVNLAKDSSNKLYQQTRQYILDKYNLNREYDVNSSVPRISLSFHNNKWIGENIIDDIYELIFNFYQQNRQEVIDESRNVDTLVDSCEYQYDRAAIKKVFMFAFFDDTTDKNIGCHVCHNMKDWENKDEVYRQIAIFKEAAQCILGDFEHSEIFFHESNIYMEVLNELLEKGFFVWQVYDCWFAHKDGVTQSEYQELVSQIVKEKADNYIKKIEGE